MKKRSVYREHNQKFRKSSRYKKNILQAEIVKFTDDNDLILRLSQQDKIKSITEVLYTPKNKDPILKIGDTILVEITETPNDEYLLNAKFISTINDNRITILGIFEKHGNKGIILSITKGSQKKWNVNPNFENDAINGDIVEAEETISKYQKEDAKIISILGNVNDAKSLSLIAINEHNIPHRFPEEVFESYDEVKVSQKSRTDLRDLSFVTIDPSDARDHDDAVFALHDKDKDNLGGFIVWVAIADVAQYVKIESPIDLEARKRGNSTYFTDRVIPMLPEKLSTDLCSLNENLERPCIAVYMKINSKGEKITHEFVRGTIISKASLNYEEVQESFDGITNKKTKPLYEIVLKPLLLAYQATVISKQRRQPLKLNLPERQIKITDKGEVDSIKFKKQLIAHELIEEFMIMANVCAAETLTKKNINTLFRIHEEPKIERINFLMEAVKSIGLNLPKSQVLKTADLNKLLYQASKTDYSEVINLNVLRTMTQAYYSNKESSHFGLNLRKYVHFTSPIRRYADLLVHRALITAHNWDNEDMPSKGELPNLEKIASHISITERRSMVAERETIDRYLARYLKDKVGGEFHCTISGITRFGIFIQLNEIGADGLIPLSNFSNEYYKYNENENSLTGSLSNRKIQIGMSAIAILIASDEKSGGLRFKLLELNDKPFEQLRKSKKFTKRKRKLRKKKVKLNETIISKEPFS
jgi:ribonuclease R